MLPRGCWALKLTVGGRPDLAYLKLSALQLSRLARRVTVRVNVAPVVMALVDLGIADQKSGD